MPTQPLLCWIDLETTGLEAIVHSILEIAMVVTTSDLEPIGQFETIISHYAGDLEWNDAARALHAANGLAARLETGISIRDAELQATRELIRCRHAHTHSLTKDIDDVPVILLAGHSVHFDRSFMQEQMRTLLANISHRNFDVSVLQRANEMWDLGISLPKDEKSHRAMPDALHAIGCAKAFRDWAERHGLGDGLVLEAQ